MKIGTSKLAIDKISNQFKIIFTITVAALLIKFFNPCYIFTTLI